MPELPEVETTILNLRIKVRNRTFIDVWTDFKKMVKKPSFDEFKKRFKNKKGKIKQILMDQSIVSGIGNIYSDEILFEARIHPFREIKKLTNEEIKRIYQATKKILKKAVELKGTILKVYRREGEKCSRCGAIIKRVKLAGRSAHFCPKCQG